MKTQPRKAQIIVTIIEQTQVGSIILPANTDKPFRWAKIVAVGPEVNVNLCHNTGQYVEKPDPHRLEVGMKVMLTPHQGLPFEEDGKKYTMLNGDGAFAVVPD